MDITELTSALHSLNESEQFYQNYQEMKKRDPRIFEQYLRTLNVPELRRKNLLVPEIIETMPPVMEDYFFYDEEAYGVRFMKHNCYSPVFVHRHSFFEMFYVVEGTCEHEVCGLHQHMVMGDFCIVPPGIEHSLSVMDKSIVIVGILSRQVLEQTFSNSLYYRENLLSDFFRQNIYIKDANNYLIFHTGNDQDLRSTLYELLLESLNQYAEYEVILQSLTGAFFGKLIRYYHNTCEFPRFTNKTASRIYGITSFIQENLAEVSLQQVADKFHYTPEYTSKFIRENTGKTFSELLNDFRLKHALSLLTATNLSIGDIAASIGYMNPESFIRVFKKQYHQTPSAYRKERSKASP